MTTMMRDLDLVGPNRARLYELLAGPFEFPDARSADAWRKGDWGRQVNDELEALGLAGNGGALRLEDGFEAFEVEFIGLFEVGLGGAPCPLHSGYYKRDRMRDLEEVVRFYRFFDYGVTRTADKFPDHLAFELKFMAHLVMREAEGEESLSSLRLAQRDFLDRHLTNYVPRLARAIEQRAEIGFIRDVAKLTETFVDQDRAALHRQLQAEVQNA